MMVTLGLLAGGCETRRQAKVGIGVGLGVLAIGGFLVSGAAGPGGETDPEDYAGPFLIVGGIITAVSLGFYMARLDSSQAPAPAADPAAERAARERAEARDRAWQLTKQAAAAARAGDCATVVTHDATVKQLDADFHATVFLRDAGIARCLAPPPLAPPP